MSLPVDAEIIGCILESLITFAIDWLKGSLRRMGVLRTRDWSHVTMALLAGAVEICWTAKARIVHVLVFIAQVAFAQAGSSAAVPVIGALLHCSAAGTEKPAWAQRTLFRVLTGKPRVAVAVRKLSLSGPVRVGVYRAGNLLLAKSAWTVRSHRAFDTRASCICIEAGVTDARRLVLAAFRAARVRLAGLLVFAPAAKAVGRAQVTKAGAIRSLVHLHLIAVLAATLVGPLVALGAKLARLHHPVTRAVEARRTNRTFCRITASPACIAGAIRELFAAGGGI
jgi:hypothetical protein